MILGRLTVMTVRHDRVFVPQDLEFMGLRPAEPQAISARLAPLIAHGRAGFGGAICTTRDHGLLLCLVRQAQAEQVLFLRLGVSLRLSEFIRWWATRTCFTWRRPSWDR